MTDTRWAAYLAASDRCSTDSALMATLAAVGEWLDGGGETEAADQIDDVLRRQFFGGARPVMPDAVTERWSRRGTCAEAMVGLMLDLGGQLPAGLRPQAYRTMTTTDAAASAAS